MYSIALCFKPLYANSVVVFYILLDSAGFFPRWASCDSSFSGECVGFFKQRAKTPVLSWIPFLTHLHLLTGTNIKRETARKHCNRHWNMLSVFPLTRHLYRHAITSTFCMTITVSQLLTKIQYKIVLIHRLEKTNKPSSFSWILITTNRFPHQSNYQDIN